MRLISLTFSLFLVVLLSSCASSGTDKYYPVQNTLPRVSSLGFYISPPPGEDWYEKHKDETIYYFKNVRGTNYALTTQAKEVKLASSGDAETLKRFVKTRLKERLRGDYIKDAHMDIHEEKISSCTCVSYLISYNDYGSSQRGNYPFIRIFNKGLLCSHPDSPEDGLDISYTETSLPPCSTIPGYLQKEGEGFIAGLSYYEVKDQKQKLQGTLKN